MEAKNGYVALWKGKRIEVYANTAYEAQRIAAAQLKVKRSWEVLVMLAEKDGKPVIHDGSEL